MQDRFEFLATVDFDASATARLSWFSGMRPVICIEGSYYSSVIWLGHADAPIPIGSSVLVVIELPLAFVMSPLPAGMTFEICEGPSKVVGHGVVE
jgi:hypothetical protein